MAYSLRPKRSESEEYKPCNSMKIQKKKKQWTTPAIKEISIFFECTCYAGAR